MGGYYQRDDPEMELWFVAVQETRAVLEGGWAAIPADLFEAPGGRQACAFPRMTGPHDCARAREIRTSLPRA